MAMITALKMQRRRLANHQGGHGGHGMNVGGAANAVGAEKLTCHGVIYG
ncbi:hypothetical protein [Magnetovibrio blakemorei]|nr:hypothetical protein [Magnetovibrio blakemorei]